VRQQTRDLLAVASEHGLVAFDPHMEEMGSERRLHSFPDELPLVRASLGRGGGPSEACRRCRVVLLTGGSSMGMLSAEALAAASAGTAIVTSRDPTLEAAFGDAIDVVDGPQALRATLDRLLVNGEWRDKGAAAAAIAERSHGARDRLERLATFAGALPESPSSLPSL